MQMSKKDEQIFVKKTSLLIAAVDKIYPSMRTLMFRSFIQGIFIAMGSTIGFAIIIAILTFIISQLKTIPFLDSIIEIIRVEEVIPEN
ncbi:MAG: DUF5665 domain-containing protein [Patescibacteria group bacterium]